MRDANLVYPMLAMVLLTAGVLGVMFRSRVRAVREGKVSGRFYKLYQGEHEPEYAVKSSRHFTNLFEAPTLFYAACLTAIVTHQVTVLTVSLAWIYGAVRVVHAFIHLRSNKLRLRMRAYFTSWLVLLALWIAIAVEVTMAA